MNDIFRDLRYSRRKMIDEVVPGLLERGARLDTLGKSVQILVDDTDTFGANAERLNRQKEKCKLLLGLICLFLCVVTVAWYLLSERTDERIYTDTNALPTKRV